MARFLIRDNCRIDLVTAYCRAIDLPVSIYIPGESLIISQLDSKCSAQGSTRLMKTDYNILSIYKSSSSKAFITLTNLNQAKNSEYLSSSIQSLLVSESMQLPEEILLGVAYHKPEHSEALTSVFRNIIDFLKVYYASYKTFTITIACTNSQRKEFYKILDINYHQKAMIFYRSQNMRLDLHDKIICKFCREIPIIAYTNTCCNIIYCESCKLSAKRCFDCICENPEFVEERFVNSFLQDMLYMCKCNTTTSFGNIRRHAFQCEFSLFKCKADVACNFEGTQAEIVAHVISSHNKKVLEEIIYTTRMIEPSSSSKECPKCYGFTFDGAFCSNCDFRFTNFESLLSLLQI